MTVLLVMDGCGGGLVKVASPATVAADGSGTAAKQKVLTTLAITPGAVSVMAGDTEQYGVTGSYDDGSTASLTGKVQWGTSDAALAAINAAGLLRTSGSGTVTVTASSGQVSATAQLVIAEHTAVPATFATSVQPVEGEDLAGACSYEMLLTDSTRPVDGVWVIFERVDSAGRWQDAGLRALAGQLRLGLLYAHQCNAGSYGDIQSDGRKGPARALSSALNQFASLSGHAEVADAKLALFGFSAAGVLSLTAAEWMPDRIPTVVTYAAGSAPLELRQLTPSAALEGIPVLMLANGNDNMAGNSMSRVYFQSGRGAGAPWAFAVQPGVGHCCTMTAQPMLLAWVGSVVSLR